MTARDSTTRSKRVLLRPANAFDLIRLLARSQNDPRKAVCELVQNSLDAQARRIEITWLNEHEQRTLRIWDDGGGVFPELERRDALQRIAQTIGHSHKRSLTPAQRRELMAVGKYGIGLLGFWSVGRFMDIKSRVGGGETLVLRLERDRETATIEVARARRIAEEPTYTEVVIRAIDEGATRQVRPNRLQAYLASELRGQLLQRDVAIGIHDRIARGRAHKHFVVRPQRFLGSPIVELSVLPVPGREDARVELYLVGSDEDRAGRVQLACGGTTVLDDLSWADGESEPRAPWSSGRIEGVIDFPELEVAPGTRRGFQHDDAAVAFLDALRVLEMRLMAILSEDEAARRQEQNRTIAREIRRAFRRVATALPEYELYNVRARGEHVAGSEGRPSEGAPVATGSRADLAQVVEPESARCRAGRETEASQLFPPGPLARVVVQPGRLRIAPGAVRTLRARALDADGRRVGGEVAWRWTLEGPGALQPGFDVARYQAAGEQGSARILVEARCGEACAEAAVPVDVVAELAGQERAAGIPEPVAVHAPGERWRSRMQGGHWEFNSGHKDYEAACTSEARRVRYLVHLYAKEIVLRNFAGAGDQDLLERMVQVLVHLDGA